MADGRDSLVEHDHNFSHGRSTKTEVHSEAPHREQADELNRDQKNHCSAGQKERADKREEEQPDDREEEQRDCSKERGETGRETEKPNQRPQDEYDSIADDAPKIRRRFETEELGGLSSELEAGEAGV